MGNPKASNKVDSDCYECDNLIVIGGEAVCASPYGCIKVEQEKVAEERKNEVAENLYDYIYSELLE